MSRSNYIHKRHNVSILVYHFVTPSKYRRVIFDKKVDEGLREVCIEIEKRYEINFLEIGVDKDHVQYLIQSLPNYSPKKITQIVKSVTAREMFKKFPKLKEKLWGTEFWTKGYFISTVGKHGDEDKIRNYVKNQGQEDYRAIHQGQLTLF